MGTHSSYELGCPSRTVNWQLVTLLNVSEKEEGVTALHLPRGPFQTRSGLEQVPRCEPSTLQPTVLLWSSYSTFPTPHASTPVITIPFWFNGGTDSDDRAVSLHTTSWIAHNNIIPVRLPSLVLSLILINGT